MECGTFIEDMAVLVLVVHSFIIMIVAFYSLSESQVTNGSAGKTCSLLVQQHVVHESEYRHLFWDSDQIERSESGTLLFNKNISQVSW